MAFFSFVKTCSCLFLTRWQSPPESTSWIKTAGPSGLLEPPPMVMPKLLERATEMSWITPSPGWLRTQRHISTVTFNVKAGFARGFVDPVWKSTNYKYCWTAGVCMRSLNNRRAMRRLMWILSTRILPEGAQHGPAAVVHVLRACWAQQ